MSKEQKQHIIYLDCNNRGSPCKASDTSRNANIQSNFHEYLGAKRKPDRFVAIVVAAQTKTYTTRLGVAPPFTRIKTPPPPYRGHGNTMASFLGSSGRDIDSIEEPLLDAEARDLQNNQTYESVSPELTATTEPTPPQMFFLLLRACIGPGALALPWAFSAVGSLLAPLASVVIGALMVYCSHLLIKSSEILHRETGEPYDSYASLAKRTYGSAGEIVTKVLIVVLQIGICAVQINFAAESLAPLLPDVNPRVRMTLVTVPVFILSVIKDLRKFTPFAVIGNHLHLTHPTHGTTKHADQTSGVSRSTFPFPFAPHFTAAPQQ